MSLMTQLRAKVSHHGERKSTAARLAQRRVPGNAGPGSERRWSGSHRDQMAKLSAIADIRLNSVNCEEPPEVNPHVRWCGSREGNPRAEPIRRQLNL